MKIDIVSRWNGSVLFSHDCENNTLKITVEAGASWIELAKLSKTKQSRWNESCQ